MNVNITVTGVEDAIALLEKAKNIETPLLEACRELIESAALTVISSYQMMAVRGNDDFHTSIEPIEHGYRLTVSGEDVGFLEFGAGVFVDTTDEFVSEVDYPVYPGSWSELQPHSPNARYFAKDRFWWWSNYRYEGLIATRGMQKALDKIRIKAEEVVKRKIDEWLGN